MDAYTLCSSIRNSAPFLWKSVPLGACIPLDLISASIWSDFCTQEVSEKKRLLQKLMQICVCQRICSSSKCFQHSKVALKALWFTANLQLESQPSLRCTTRIVFAKGNWARLSSLWRKELTMQCFSFSFLAVFHLKSLRLVYSPVTSHQMHLLEQVTAETQGQGREDLWMGWFLPAFFMLYTSAEMSGESLCH